MTETLSESGAPPQVSDGLGPDLPGAVAEAKAELSEPAPRRGRPPGSRNKKRGRPPAAEPLPPAEPTEADIKGAAKFAGIIWKIGGGMFGRRPLTPAEELELGEPLALLMQKYLPDAMEYSVEIGLAFTLIGLWEATAPPKVKEIGPGDPGTQMEAGGDDA